MDLVWAYIVRDEVPVNYEAYVKTCVGAHNGGESVRKFIHVCARVYVSMCVSRKNATSSGYGGGAA